jgi:hypothetical protein
MTKISPDENVKKNKDSWFVLRIFVLLLDTKNYVEHESNAVLQARRHPKNPIQK